MSNELNIQGENLSHCWLRALRTCRPSGSASGMMVRINTNNGGMPEEDMAIRASVDKALTEAEEPTVHETAGTIFPQDLWLSIQRREHADASSQDARRSLYQSYFERFLPTYQARRKVHGLSRLKETYFQRMTDYLGDVDKWSGDQFGNQVERAICSIQHGLALPKPTCTRISGLSIAIFDPRKDFTKENMVIPAQCGFPCLQQVSVEVSRNTEKKRIIWLHAMYPSEYIFNRAYGNYLGLAHLGAFISQAVGLALGGISVYIAKASIGECPSAALDQIERSPTVISMRGD